MKYQALSQEQIQEFIQESLLEAESTHAKLMIEKKNIESRLPVTGDELLLVEEKIKDVELTISNLSSGQLVS